MTSSVPSGATVVAVASYVLLTDRSASDVPTGLAATGADLKVEPLDLPAATLRDLAPHAVLVDAVGDAGRGYEVLTELARRLPEPARLAVVAAADLERFPWEEVADDILLPHASPAEIRLRLAMAHRRMGSVPEAGTRLGPLFINTESYRVTLDGRPLDLTFKEFELLRFLAQRPGRAFTREQLLREVWGYDFYGGARTVDVHIRRLRAKLGPEHEDLIETVRGVGYRAAGWIP
jgi:DNA-binding response OmpR family regulator